MGDELLEFGSVTQENFTSLQDIAAVVKHSNGVGWSTSCKHNVACTTGFYHGLLYSDISWESTAIIF